MKLCFSFAAALSVAAAVTIPVDVHRRAETDPIAHGNYLKSGGKVWRYHQLADNIFTGVPPEEWDPEVHVADDTKTTKPTLEELHASPPPQANPPPQSGHPRSLDDRDLRAFCRATYTCTVDAAASGGTALFGMATWLTLQVQTQGPKVWEELNRPLLANFFGVGGQNFLVEIYTTKKANKDGKAEDPSDCSDKMSQTDLFQSLVKKACAANPKASAMSIDVPYPDGSVQTLHLQAAKGTKLGDSEVCGAAGIE